MYCIFCNHKVLSGTELRGQPTTVPGLGIAHRNCAIEDMIRHRVFRGLRLRELSVTELEELNDMVLAELNQKREVNTEVELFLVDAFASLS